MSETLSTASLLQTLKEAGAAHVDAVGWHYIETLAARTRAQTGAAQRLLQGKLQRALSDMQQRISTAPQPRPQAKAQTPPSPMAQLLKDMTPVAPAASTASLTPRSTESPRVRQFRRQLRKISVQKQVSRAMAQAPLNAGPINSHMLVVRALGLMRDISPDYLNRFMAQVDTLLCLEDAEKARLAPRKTPAATRTKNKS